MANFTKQPLSRFSTSIAKPPLNLLVVYQNAFLASDSVTLEQLKELSAKRKTIETTNEKSYITEAIAREMSGGLTSRCERDIQKLEQHLPLLQNLVDYINVKGMNHRLTFWIPDVKIRWTSTLTSSSIFHHKSPKFYQINDVYFELGIILFLYGAMLRKRALEVLPSADLVQSATLFRKAAAVYKYLAHEVLIHLIQAEDRPPEATSRMSSVMSLICLAEAQAVTRRETEENANNAGVIAKLHYGITEFLVEAIDMLQVSNEEGKDISSRFLDYVLSCKTLHELKCYECIAKALQNDGKTGAAIEVLRRALANAKKSSRKEPWRLVYKQALDYLTGLLEKYERENDFIWHENVPSNDELPLPQAVKIVTLMPYQSQKWARTIIFKL